MFAFISHPSKSWSTDSDNIPCAREPRHLKYLLRRRPFFVPLFRQPTNTDNLFLTFLSPLSTPMKTHYLILTVALSVLQTLRAECTREGVFCGSSIGCESFLSSRSFFSIPICIKRWRQWLSPARTLSFCAHLFFFLCVTDIINHSQIQKRWQRQLSLRVCSCRRYTPVQGRLPYEHQWWVPSSKFFFFL